MNEFVQEIRNSVPQERIAWRTKRMEQLRRLSWSQLKRMLDELSPGYPLPSFSHKSVLAEAVLEFEVRQAFPAEQLSLSAGTNQEKGKQPKGA